MKRALQEALAECVARLEAGASIDDCLRGRGARTAELRPLLEAAAALRAGQGRIPEYTTQGFQSGRARMQAARAHQAEDSSGSLWPRFFGRPAALLAMVAVVALVAVLGFTTELFRFGADTTSAHVEGVVSRVDPDAIILTTADGQVVISIGEDTIVVDAQGTVISGGDIVPGRLASVEVEMEDGAFAGLRVEIEDNDDDETLGAEVEFDGVVEAVGEGAITVRASFGAATVLIDTHTEVKGTLAVGLTVEVHATPEGDGSFTAREIRAEGSGDDNEGLGVDDNTGTGEDDVDEGDGDEPSDSSGPGSGDDGPEEEED